MNPEAIMNCDSDSTGKYEALIVLEGLAPGPLYRAILTALRKGSLNYKQRKKSVKHITRINYILITEL